MHTYVLKRTSFYNRGNLDICFSEGTSDEFKKEILQDNQDMEKVHEKLQPILDKMTDLMNGSISDWLDSQSVETTLQDIISSYINTIGTKEQKLEYNSIDITV